MYKNLTKQESFQLIYSLRVCNKSKNCTDLKLKRTPQSTCLALGYTFRSGDVTQASKSLTLLAIRSLIQKLTQATNK